LIDAHTHLLQNYEGRLGGDDPNMLVTVATPRVAAEAGVNSIEHAYIVPDAVLRIMAQKGIYLVATVYPATFYVDGLGGPMSEAKRARVLADMQEFAKGNAERLMRARAMGVKIAFGSDEYYDIAGMTRGEASLLPLEAYQQAGMPPIDVLRAATINSADLLGLGDQIGTLEPDKLADIIAVPGNPLDDVKLLRKARFVMKAGQIIKR
jgi:imidazolonepropionase-like amidohydrolase